MPCRDFPDPLGASSLTARDPPSANTGATFEPRISLTHMAIRHCFLLRVLQNFRGAKTAQSRYDCFLRGIAEPRRPRCSRMNPTSIVPENAGRLFLKELVLVHGPSA